MFLAVPAYKSHLHHFDNFFMRKRSAIASLNRVHKSIGVQEACECNLR